MQAKILFSLSPELLKRVDRFDLSIKDSLLGRPAVESAINKTVLKGGKRLRPMLTLLFGDFFSLGHDQVLPYAKLIEMIHAASLAHDDVIDLADERRGKATLNYEQGNKKAVLAGDYLLAEVISKLCEYNQPEILKRTSKVIQRLSWGEWLQCDHAASKDYSWDVIEEIAAHKTASVMEWCCYVPAILSDASPKALELCKQLGHDLGLAFQIMDDTLDYKGDGEKEALIDLKNGQANAVAVAWFSLNPAAFTSFKKGEELTDIWERDLHLHQEAISNAQRRALKHLESCRTSLQLLIDEVGPPTKSVKSINAIIDYLGARKR